MSINENQSAASQGEPSLKEKFEGEREVIKGDVDIAHGKRVGDPLEVLGGGAEKVSGLVEKDISIAAGDVIAEAEKQSAGDVLDGVHHRVHGAMKEAEGKAEAAIGHRHHDADRESAGLEKQALGGIEKEAGRIEATEGNEAFKEALHADAEYVKPKHYTGTRI